jgi:hypothetical protein
MRRPLFQQFSEPFAVLVEAVRSEKPEIHADDVAADLVLLAHNCLVKAPDARLALVSWDDFDVSPSTKQSVESARERVRKRALLARSQTGGKLASPALTAKERSQRILGQLDNCIRLECAGSDSFPPMQIIPRADGATEVQVIFAATPDRALPHELSIRFACELLDQATMTVSISASAGLLPAGVPRGEPPSSASVFRGPLDSASLPARVQAVLWCAVDLAQQQSTASHMAGDTLWLDLARGLEG